MKNCICIISIGRDHLLDMCLKSVEGYCDKFNIDLKVLKEKKINLKTSKQYNYLTFEKNQVYELYDEYDRILRLDSDILIKPNTPNLFLLKSDYIYASREDVYSRRMSRLSEIKLIKSELGDIPSWNDFYFNSGVILASYQHKEIYQISEQDKKIIESKNLGSFKEQNFLNWRCRINNFKIRDLGPKYNRTRIYDNIISKEESYILHYAGPQKGKREKMLSDYEKFF